MARDITHFQQAYMDICLISLNIIRLSRARGRRLRDIDDDIAKIYERDIAAL